MKARCLWMAVFAAFFPVSVRAQTGQGIAVNPKSETLLEMVSGTEYGLEFRNRLGGIDEAACFSVPQGAYSTASVAGIPRQFTTLSVRGYAFTNKAGRPMLPVRVEMIEVPQGAVPRVVYGKTAYKDVDLAKAGYPQPLYPAQPPVSKSAGRTPDFVYDVEAYRADGFFADEQDEELVEVEVLGEMRGTRIAKILVKPFRYNAARHMLRVYTTLDFEIVFDHADWQSTYEKQRRYASPAFGFLRGELANPSKAAIHERPLRYVIVADPMFKDSLQKFVDWKTRFGFEVVQAYTDEPEVGKTASSIRAYLKKLYDEATSEAPAPSYVLFVGDLAQVPTQTYGKNDWSGSGKHYSDLYLCEYTGDHFPEVQYGRMSATTVEELMPQIDKLIHMESLSPGHAAFLDTAVAIAGSDDGRFDDTHLNPTINYICSYYLKDTLQRHTYKYLAPESSWKSDDILRRFNDGLSFILYTAHGDYDGWSDPSVNVSDVNTMTNKGKYPLAIGNCCLTGKFDMSTCYGEALLRKKDAGAVGYIGASDVTYFDQDVYWAIGYTERIAKGVVQTYEKTELVAFDALHHTHGEAYEDWALTAYEIVHAGNMAVQRANQDLEDYYWEVYHVFGDPSYMPYLHGADYPQADYRDELMVGETSFSIQTVPYARVTISKDGEILGFAMADPHGSAEVPLHGLDEPGEYDLVVAAQGHLPLHAKLNVLVPEGKYVIVAASQWLDVEEKPVKSVLYGETYKLRLSLRNVGEETVGKVEADLFSDDRYLTVEDGRYTLTTPLQAGEEKVLDHSFVMKVGTHVPNNHRLAYGVRLVLDDTSQEASTREFHVRAEAPELKVVAFRIDDSSGSKPNGVLDNGETVKGTIQVMNMSRIKASDVKVKVSSSSDFLILPDEEMELGDLDGQQGKELSFSYGARQAGVYYAFYWLDFTFESKGRTSKDSVRSYIEPVVETFESGDFTFVDWDKSSDWEIDGNKFHGGKFSAASKTIADNESSSLKINVNVPVNDRVGFYYLTSSEVLHDVLGDFLEFYIDGKRQGRWAGETAAWGYAEYPLAAGPHTLEWRYKKDASDAQGADKVWIDDVRLPVGTHAPVGVANEDRQGEGGNEGFLRSVSYAEGTLRVAYDTDKPRTGSLYVVDVNGRRLKTLAKAWQVQGRGQADLVLGKVPAGVYLLVFENAKETPRAMKFVVFR